MTHNGTKTLTDRVQSAALRSRTYDKITSSSSGRHDPPCKTFHHVDETNQAICWRSKNLFSAPDVLHPKYRYNPPSNACHEQHVILETKPDASITQSRPGNEGHRKRAGSRCARVEVACGGRVLVSKAHNFTDEGGHGGQATQEARLEAL